jgi:hypothetical protein
MYVVVQHKFKDPQRAFSRGERLIKNEGAPTGVQGLQFYPARDGSGATCLWEADSLQDVQGSPRPQNGKGTRWSKDLMIASGEGSRAAWWYRLSGDARVKHSRTQGNPR